MKCHRRFEESNAKRPRECSTWCYIFICNHIHRFASWSISLTGGSHNCDAVVSVVCQANYLQVLGMGLDFLTFCHVACCWCVIHFVTLNLSLAFAFSYFTPRDQYTCCRLVDCCDIFTELHQALEYVESVGFNIECYSITIWK